MNGGTFQIQRRLANGYRGAVLTRSPSPWTAPRHRSGRHCRGAERQGPRVGVGDPSSFDRRHQFSGNALHRASVGAKPSLAQGWRHACRAVRRMVGQLNVTLQSGTPLTARVLGANSRPASAASTDCSAPTTTARRFRLSNPTIDEFFNVAAFSAPAQGMFGSSLRNTIVFVFSRRPPAGRDVPTRCSSRRQSRDDAAGQRGQPAQRRPVGRGGHQRQLADVRPGDVGAPDAHHHRVGTIQGTTCGFRDPSRLPPSWPLPSF